LTGGTGDRSLTAGARHPMMSVDEPRAHGAKVETA